MLQLQSREAKHTKENSKDIITQEVFCEQYFKLFSLLRKLDAKIFDRKIILSTDKTERILICAGIKKRHLDFEILNM